MLSNNEKGFIRQLHQKKYRTEHKKYLIEGEKMIDEAIRSGVEITNIYAKKEWIAVNEAKIQIPVTELNEKELSQISQLKTPNNVVAVIDFSKNNPKLKFEKLTICLDSISDPGNMGTILRIADWFGINQIICSPDTVEIYNSKVVQASMGSIFRVNAFYLDLEDFLKNHSNKYPLYVADMAGENIFDAKYNYPAMLLMGNESAGINEKYLPFATKKISIPGSGKAESLNVAVSCGIVCAALLQ